MAKEMHIKFQTTGHDEFIDFIKSYAILCVILGHTFPLLDKIGYGIWAGMQVPLFILIQTFHYLKKERSFKINISKILGRVVVPFIIAEILTFIVALLVKKENASILIQEFIQRGGYGPGSYYPYIYLQITLLLPFFAILLKHSSTVNSPMVQSSEFRVQSSEFRVQSSEFRVQSLLIVFLLLSEGCEILFSLTNFPDTIYRILAIRYIFLIYLGWLWVKDGVIINKTTILLSVLSLCAIIYFEYGPIDNEPWFYSTGWRFHRWPCYFFVANGFIAILHYVWKYLKNNKFIVNAVKTIASATYEIFLMQMSVIYLFTTKSITFTSNIMLRYIIWLVIVWTISVGGGILINKIINKANDKDNR